MHLYKRHFSAVRPSVHPSVRPFVRLVLKLVEMAKNDWEMLEIDNQFPENAFYVIPMIIFIHWSVRSFVRPSVSHFSEFWMHHCPTGLVLISI